MFNKKKKESLIEIKRELLDSKINSEYDNYFNMWNTGKSYYGGNCEVVDTKNIEVSKEVDMTFQILPKKNGLSYYNRSFNNFYAFMNGRLLSPVGTNSIKRMIRNYFVPLIEMGIENKKTYCIKFCNQDMQIDLVKYKEPLPGQDFMYQDLFEDWNQNSNLFGLHERIDTDKIILPYEEYGIRTIFQTFYSISDETTYTLMNGRLIGDHYLVSVDKRWWKDIATELEEKDNGWIQINSEGELIDQSMVKERKKN